LSTLSTEDFEQIDDNNNDNMNATTKSFLRRKISTTCKAMGHTDQAAKDARRCCFAKPIYQNIPIWNTSIMVDNSKDSFRWETIFRVFPEWNNPFILLFVFVIFSKLELFVLYIFVLTDA
jgi:hypothetical protein